MGPSSRKFRHRSALLALLLAGCSETAVELVINLNAKVPDQLDALCVQLAAGGASRFARHYELTERRLGRPQTLTVLPGDTHDSFDLLLRGERRAQQVSWLRRSVGFVDGEIRQEVMDVPSCGERLGTAFVDGGRLTDKAGSAVAGVPVAFAADQAVVAWSGEARRFAFQDGELKQIPSGLPSTSAEVRALLPLNLEGGEGNSEDCDLDLVVLGPSGAQVWEHGPGGTFTPRPSAILLSGDFVAVVAADIDGDSRVDLVLGGPQGLALLLNDGQGRFNDAPGRLPPSSPKDVTALAVGPIDDDVHPDLLVGTGASTAAADAVLLNDGSASFEVGEIAALSGVTTKARGVAVATVDGDALADLVIASDSEVKIYLKGAGGLLFEPASGLLPTPLATDGISQLLAVDLNNDCTTDLVLARPGGTLVLYNTGTFVQASLGGAEDSATNAAAADLNGDGMLDLILGGGAGGARLLKQE